MLDDGGRLANAQVEDTVELDEIFTAFDPDTRQAFKDWVKELAGAIKDGPRREDLNDAFGNFEGFAVDGAKLMQVLDEQDLAVHRLVKNTGVVFGAINERQGALRELIVNSKRTFEATASRDEALAETFAIFPTFLDESKATMARLEDFSRTTRPLVNDLKGPADDLGPTVRDLGDLAPDLEHLFRDLDAADPRQPRPACRRSSAPCARRSRSPRRCTRSSPSSTRSCPTSTSTRRRSPAFITNGGADLAADYGTGQRGQTQIGITDGQLAFQAYQYGESRRRLGARQRLPPAELAQPGAPDSAGSRASTARAASASTPEDALKAGQDHDDKRAPCFEVPPSLYDGKLFALPRSGVAPLREPPRGYEGNPPAADPDPGPND